MRQTFLLLTCYALSPSHGFAVPAPSQRGPFMALRAGAIGAHRAPSDEGAGSEAD